MFQDRTKSLIGIELDDVMDILIDNFKIKNIRDSSILIKNEEEIIMYDFRDMIYEHNQSENMILIFYLLNMINKNRKCPINLCRNFIIHVDNLEMVKVIVSKKSAYDIHLNVNDFYNDVTLFKYNEKIDTVKLYSKIFIPLLIIGTGLTYWWTRSDVSDFDVSDFDVSDFDVSDFYTSDI